MRLLQVFLIWCFSYRNLYGYNILAVLPTASKSHYYIGSSLMKGLAREGHQVTVISPFKEEIPIENFTEVFLENFLAEFQRTLTVNNGKAFNNKHFWDAILTFYEAGKLIANWSLSSQNLHNFINTKHHFDVVVVDVCFSDHFLGFGQHFNAPIIALSSFGASKLTTDLVGSPNFASYVPHTLNPYTDRMSFWQRIYNSLTFWFEDIAMPYYFLSEQQKVMEKLFPNTTNWPSLDEIRRNVSLVLLNTHTTIGTPRPYAPNMIEVGGMQIETEIVPLSPEIQTFLDEANDGAIFVSLGSNVLLTKLPRGQLEVITGAFSGYPNHRILIKSDEHIVIPSHKESDVLVEPWFNQQSILAHKNIKLFVTHGGLLSITEAIYFGKPVVGIPFFFDQSMNAQLSEQKGFGISIPIETLTADRISTAVRKVLSEPSYAENAKIISSRFRDQPLFPLELGMHWVKHVAKNKGAPHLRSVAVDLPFYKLYNLDVWAFIFIVVLLGTLATLKTIKLIISFVFTSNVKRKMKET
ncbi:UDP-glucosyltransferase 2-like [Sitodiplosis mosellana]|uniref:UDP-glucosyltransferase 2-like n=1 Tax=Sitodiplosis mosellana TaxID=263140 RepID=UPI0024443573|nr:UDP-glucosyltransferase 2-like [Sitodiplosis mosellana]